MKTKIYICKSGSMKREIIARDKKEAAKLFKQELTAYITRNDKITIF